MKIMLCGEGVNDVGEPRAWNPELQNFESTEGWLQPLIRLAKKDKNVLFEIKKRRELTIFPKDAKKYRPFPQGHGAKSLIAKKLAISAQCSALIYMVDADSTDPIRQRAIIEDIEDGFSKVEGDIACIACVPMSASESWLLSDIEAWRLIAGTPEKVNLPNKPEICWGPRDNPAGDHPKHYFARVCKAASVKDSSITRSEIAARLDIKTATKACPVSLKPFIKSLNA